MDRIEAVKALNRIPVNYIGMTIDEANRADEALSMAARALRPITREQVEKVWRGCEKCNGAGEYSRYAENLTKILLAKYCPHCGRPLTDEAVDMVMERLEEVQNADTGSV